MKTYEGASAWWFNRFKDGVGDQVKWVGKGLSMHGLDVRDGELILIWHAGDLTVQTDRPIEFLHQYN